MKESEIQTDIMKMLLKHPKVAWAYVTTVGMLRGRGHYIKMGFPGLSDIIGQLNDGRLLALEIKTPGKKPTEVQAEFIDLVKRNNGLAGWCDSVDGALDILEEDL